MIPTHDVNASLELEESFISECNFSNRLISLGSDAILTNNAEIAVSNPYMSKDNITSTIFESGKITLPLINMVEFVKKQNEAYLKQHNDKKQS